MGSANSSETSGFAEAAATSAVLSASPLPPPLPPLAPPLAPLPTGPEAAEHSAQPPPPEWPAKGRIEVRGLRMRYRDETPLVLKGIDVTIEGGPRVGIVGRTGSGKSSLAAALLRLVPAASTSGSPSR